jgi:hypothetical protein
VWDLIDSRLAKEAVELWLNRMRLPHGSRNAQSLTPYGVASQSSVLKMAPRTRFE